MLNRSDYLRIKSTGKRKRKVEKKNNAFNLKPSTGNRQQATGNRQQATGTARFTLLSYIFFFCLFSLSNYCLRKTKHTYMK